MRDRHSQTCEREDSGEVCRFGDCAGADDSVQFSVVVAHITVAIGVEGNFAYGDVADEPVYPTQFEFSAVVDEKGGAGISTLNK